MKIKFLLLIFCISSLANAQSSKQRLEDIQDRLDMMQAEQEYRDAQRRIEQKNRGSGETPLQRRIRDEGFSKIFTNKDVSIYINDSLIIDMGTKNNPAIYYSYIFEFNKPQFINQKTFFNVEGNGTIYCKKSYVTLNQQILLDRQLNGVGFIPSGSGYKTKGVLEEEIQKYLCR